MLLEKEVGVSGVGGEGGGDEGGCRLWVLHCEEGGCFEGLQARLVRRVGSASFGSFSVDTGIWIWCVGVLCS